MKIKYLKKHANNKLSETDWYITREYETGSAVPTAIKTARADIRKKIDDAEVAIAAITTIDELQSYRMDF